MEIKKINLIHCKKTIKKKSKSSLKVVLMILNKIKNKMFMVLLHQKMINLKMVQCLLGKRKRRNLRKNEFKISNILIFHVFISSFIQKL